MPAPVPHALLGNPPASWLAAAALAATVVVALWVLRLLMGRRLTAAAARTATAVDDLAVDLVRRTRAYFMVAVGIRAASGALVLSAEAEDLVRDATSIAVLLQIAVWGTAGIAFWLGQWTAARGGTRRAGTAAVGAVGVAARGLLWIVIGLLALKNVWHLDITALITGLGISGIAVALAVQNILGDVFAALAIILDNPFDVGDSIAVGATTGTVEHVGLKTTRLRATTGEEVIFANAELLKQNIRNVSRMEERRLVLPVVVAGDTPPEVAAALPALFAAAVGEVPHAHLERAHLARVHDGALEFEVAFTLRGAHVTAHQEAQHLALLAILRRCAAAGARLAAPTRAVTPSGGAR